jgi:hypothetical protein
MAGQFNAWKNGHPGSKAIFYTSGRDVCCKHGVSRCQGPDRNAGSWINAAFRQAKTIANTNA